MSGTLRFVAFIAVAGATIVALSWRLTGEPFGAALRGLEIIALGAALPHVLGRAIVAVRPSSPGARIIGCIVAALVFGATWVATMLHVARTASAAGQYVCGGFGASVLVGLLVGMPIHAALVGHVSQG